MARIIIFWNLLMLIVLEKWKWIRWVIFFSWKEKSICVTERDRVKMPFKKKNDSLIFLRVNVWLSQKGHSHRLWNWCEAEAIRKACRAEYYTFTQHYGTKDTVAIKSCVKCISCWIFKYWNLKNFILKGF